MNMLQFARTGLAAVIAVCLAAGGAGAAVITENLTLPETTEGIPAMGQSVTTPSGGPWSQITFNYYEGGDTPAGEYFLDFGGDPFAIGDLFLLSQAYFGNHDNLSSSTTGYLAKSTGTQADGSGLEWTFAAEVTLQADTQYWFYMDSYPGEVLGINAAYSGGDMYYAWAAPYRLSSPSDARFQLEGVPEPSTLTLLALGGMAVIRKRRK